MNILSTGPEALEQFFNIQSEIIIMFMMTNQSVDFLISQVRFHSTKSLSYFLRPQVKVLQQTEASFLGLMAFIRATKKASQLGYFFDSFLSCSKANPGCEAGKIAGRSLMQFQVNSSALRSWKLNTLNLITLPNQKTL